MSNIGKKHNLLGIDIEFVGGKKVVLNTPHHINEALEDFGVTLKGNVANPVTSQIFITSDESKELDDERKEHYHSATANIMWIMKR